jgi:DNA-3-methyladenine glycosylase II
LADRQHSDPFIALTHAIISQQLSTKAAATIARRFDALFEGRPTAAAVASATESDLRSVGLSTQKLRYMRDLAEKIENGVLRLDLLDEMSDQDVIEALTLVKGIGRWTAEMFLMFRLHRPDVLPTDDLGIVNAVKRAYQLRSRPTAKRLLRLGESWRPYRSVACWYLWASLGNAPLKE